MVWVPNRLNELPQVHFKYHHDLIGKMNNGFFNRPVMVFAQILLHTCGPRTWILVLAHRWTRQEVKLHLRCRPGFFLFYQPYSLCPNITRDTFRLLGLTPSYIHTYIHTYIHIFLMRQVRVWQPKGLVWTCHKIYPKTKI